MAMFGLGGTIAMPFGEKGSFGHLPGISEESIWGVVHFLRRAFLASLTHLDRMKHRACDGTQNICDLGYSLIRVATDRVRSWACCVGSVPDRVRKVYREGTKSASREFLGTLAISRASRARSRARRRA